MFSPVHGDIPPPVGFVRAVRLLDPPDWSARHSRCIDLPQAPPGSFRDHPPSPLKRETLPTPLGEIPPSHHTNEPRPRCPWGNPANSHAPFAANTTSKAAISADMNAPVCCRLFFPQFKSPDNFRRRRKKTRTDPMQVLRTVVCKTVCPVTPLVLKTLAAWGRREPKSDGCAIQDSNSSSCLIQLLGDGKATS